MTDDTELRRAAEAAKAMTSKIRQSVNMGYLTPTEQDDLQKWCDYIAAASPDVVLRILDERDRLRGLVDELMPSRVIECNGDKCRYAWCASCNSDEYALAAINRLRAARSALEDK